MTQSFVLGIMNQTIVLVALLSAPMLLTSLVIGFLIALLQTVTSIQEQTLSFVPKAMICGVVLVLTMPWMLTAGSAFMQMVLSQIPKVVH